MVDNSCHLLSVSLQSGHYLLSVLLEDHSILVSPSYATNKTFTSLQLRHKVMTSQAMPTYGIKKQYTKENEITSCDLSLVHKHCLCYREVWIASSPLPPPHLTETARKPAEPVNSRRGHDC